MEAGMQSSQLASIPGLVGVQVASQAPGSTLAVVGSAGTTPWPIPQLQLGSDLERVKMQLRMVATSPALQPAICRARYPGEIALYEQQGISVRDWSSLKRKGPHSSRSAPLMRHLHHQIKPEGVISKQPLKGPGARGSKGKVNAAGRVYTSKYRGVHQTFPTRRWEAQFRRSGKPTSLGCFDDEEQAAKAYDKMMLWCELHNAGGIKGGITNFDPAEYEQDVTWLSSITQDELIEALRSDGRRQAAHRMLRHKSRDGSADSDMGEEGQDEGGEAHEDDHEQHHEQEQYEQDFQPHSWQLQRQQQQRQQQQQQQDAQHPLSTAILSVPVPSMLQFDRPFATLPPGLESSTAAAAAAAALARAGLVGSALGRFGEQQQQQQQQQGEQQQQHGQLPWQLEPNGSAQQGAAAAMSAAAPTVSAAPAAATAAPAAVPAAATIVVAAPAPAQAATPADTAVLASAAMPGLQEALAALAAATAAATAERAALPGLQPQAGPSGTSMPVKSDPGAGDGNSAAAAQPWLVPPALQAQGLQQLAPPAGLSVDAALHALSQQPYQQQQ